MKTKFSLCASSVRDERPRIVTRSQTFGRKAGDGSHYENFGPRRA